MSNQKQLTAELYYILNFIYKAHTQINLSN